MLLHAGEKSFQVLVILFPGLPPGPCVGVEAFSVLPHICEAMLGSRAPEVRFGFLIQLPRVVQLLIHQVAEIIIEYARVVARKQRYQQSKILDISCFEESDYI